MSVSLAGDYNQNGKVDAADYVLWRKSPDTYGGNPAGYNTWCANFGQPPPKRTASVLLLSTAMQGGVAVSKSRSCVRRIDKRVVNSPS